MTRPITECPHFRWVERMGATKGATVLKVTPGGLRVHSRHRERYWTWHTAGKALLNPGDPATRGALLGLVREAWGNPRLVVVALERDGNEGRGWALGWFIGMGSRRMFQHAMPHEFDTEYQALEAALWAAPTRAT